MSKFEAGDRVVSLINKVLYYGTVIKSEKEHIGRTPVRWDNCEYSNLEYSIPLTRNLRNLTPLEKAMK